MSDLPEGIVDYCREKLCVDLPAAMKIDPNYAKFIINVYSAGIKQGSKKSEELLNAELNVGKWMSAALDDPDVCAEMKLDITRWFTAIEGEAG